jgi:hypothetical protein
MEINIVPQPVHVRPKNVKRGQLFYRDPPAKYQSPHGQPPCFRTVDAIEGDAADGYGDTSNDLTVLLADKRTRHG